MELRPSYMIRWLSEIDVYLDNEEFEEWRDAREDSMTWDLIEYWETWHDVNCDGTIEEIFEEERLFSITVKVSSNNGYCGITSALSPLF
jgi:hypothetical protein